MQENKEVSDFVTSLDIHERLNLRDAFFGGRTNAVKLYKKVEDDFCSLYPSVNKYCKYHLKHPRIIIKEFENIENYFGIAKVKVLPPRNLYFPVLPQKINGKLVFSLCRN